jgi:hypothetical protein
MNTASHALMGNLICDYVRQEFSICLHRKDFIWGNVLPDYRLSFLTRPHFLKRNIAYVKKEIENLLNRKQTSAFIGNDYSKHLGIICHYYADFFCYAHSQNFPGNLAAHREYEDNLHLFFMKNHEFISRRDYSAALIKKIDVEVISREFFKLHKEYNAATASYYNDLAHCFLACIQVILLITSVSVMKMPDEWQLGYEALAAV